jgi:REP element-mobilizing transposase RayT
MSPETPFHRRHLPHFYPPDAIYFVTSRLADSLPPSVIKRARKEREILESKESKGKREPSGLPPYVDELDWWEKVIERGSKNARWLADPRIASLVAESIHYRDGKDYDLVAYTIMPNHIHIVYGIGQYDLLERPHDAGPLSGKQVSGIMMSMKRHTAAEANKLLGRTGPFWQDESYDHVVRDTEELARIIEYVLDNPVKAGLVDSRRDWKWFFSRFDP